MSSKREERLHQATLEAALAAVAAATEVLAKHYPEAPMEALRDVVLHILNNPERQLRDALRTWLWLNTEI